MKFIFSQFEDPNFETSPVKGLRLAVKFNLSLEKPWQSQGISFLLESAFSLQRGYQSCKTLSLKVKLQCTIDAFLLSTVWEILGKTVNYLLMLLFQSQFSIGQESFPSLKMSLKRHSNSALGYGTILGFVNLNSSYCVECWRSETNKIAQAW